MTTLPKPNKRKSNIEPRAPRGGRRAGSGKPAAGRGVLFEIRNALNLNQSEMAARLGFSSFTSISRLELTGKVPTGGAYRANLLSAARSIDAREIPASVRDWIATETDYWRDLAPPGVFL